MRRLGETAQKTFPQTVDRGAQTVGIRDRCRRLGKDHEIPSRQGAPAFSKTLSHDPLDSVSHRRTAIDPPGDNHAQTGMPDLIGTGQKPKVWIGDRARIGENRIELGFAPEPRRRWEG
ncbi:MAG: hypothetical protein R3200_16385 [Xanthomonadales bacterium]|nr:hypothetical protein [Xanthomonadales bacterium]